MSYEDDDGWEGGPEDDGPLTAVATFLTVHEAELARGKLEAEGFPASIWDAGIVSADPLIALAVHGVKVMVPRRFATRAAAVLSHEVRMFAGEARPVFRVHAPHGRNALALALVLGLILGIGLVRAFDAPIFVVVGLVVGVIGHFVARRFRSDYCSNCAAVLPAREIAACPGCAMVLRGTIAHPDERLAAEEGCDER